MSSAAGNGRQVLIAIGVVVLIAILATQTYALVMAAPGTSGGSGASNSKTISVSGSGQIEIQPDRAILTIGVVAQAADAATAVQENANRMNSVIAALEGMGISNSSIQTTSYNIYPQTNHNGTVTSYQVSNQVSVTVIESGQTLGQLGARVGQVIDAAASQGANEMYGIQFTASKSALQQAQQSALQQAVQNASQEAHVLASAAGVSITGVVSLSTSYVYTPPVYLAAVTTAAAATPVVPPQSLTVTTTVQAVYSIG